MQPEDILIDHTPEVRRLAEDLRRLVRETAPEASEVAYPVWHAIGFRHPRLGYFCGIFPQKETANLLFEFGILLPDPHGLLQGQGKQVRYVPVRTPEDILVEPLRQLILAAISLPDKRSVRLEMVRNAARLRGE
jgi:hypothetical protein